MNNVQFQGSRMASRFLLRRGQGSARSPRRAASVSLPAALAVAALGALTATPAMASPARSTTSGQGGVMIAARGPHDDLRFYWAAAGSSTWHHEQVAGPGTTFSAPSMITNQNSIGQTAVAIAAEGSRHSLRFYWIIDGTNAWNHAQVARAGTTFSAPSMTADTNENRVAISALGPGRSLRFYWNTDGISTWHAEHLAGRGTTFSAPSIAIQHNSIGQTGITIAAQAPHHSLQFYWIVEGSRPWHHYQVPGAGPGTTFSAPLIGAEGNNAIIAAQGPDQSQRFTWAVNGTRTWHLEQVARPNTTFSAPSMTTDGNNVILATRGPRQSLRFYWNTNGTSIWHRQQVAGANTTISAPSVATSQ